MYPKNAGRRPTRPEQNWQQRVAVVGRPAKIGLQRCREHDQGDAGHAVDQVRRRRQVEIRRLQFRHDSRLVDSFVNSHARYRRHVRRRFDASRQRVGSGEFVDAEEDEEGFFTPMLKLFAPGSLEPLTVRLMLMMRMYLMN